MRNKLLTLLVIAGVGLSCCGLISCSSGTTGGTPQNPSGLETASVVGLFQKAGELFARASTGSTSTLTVTVRNIEQVTPSKIVYTEVGYGFSVTLPQGWAGFQVFGNDWQGQISGKTSTESGPYEAFLSPIWPTSSDINEAIPVMMFTATQWSAVQDGTLHNITTVGGLYSATTIFSSFVKFGENAKYIFAVPSDFAQKAKEVLSFSTKDVDSILDSTQTSGYVTAELWVEEEFTQTASSDWRLPLIQSWLDRNKYYLSNEQISAVQDWLKNQMPKTCSKDDPLCAVETSSGYWGYRLYTPSLDEARKGNYDVWFWTNIDKLPQGEITNWQPIVLTYFGSGPEDVYKELFQLVEVPCPQDNAK